MTESGFWTIVGLSVQISGTAVLISSAVGLPLGAWLGLSRARIIPLCRLIIFTAMALPPVVVGLMLYILLSRSGPLAGLGWLFTWRAMVLAQVLLTLPFVVGITMNSVAAVPRELLPQLRSLGASERQARWAVLGEARAGVLLAVGAAIGRSVSEVGAVLMVGGNIAGHTRVLTTAIVLETSKGNFDFALLLGAALMTLALLANLLVLAAHGGDRADA